MKTTLLRHATVILYWNLMVSTGSAWDYEGHRMVNQLALASLPTNFPAFVRTPDMEERIAFLGGEPDRWRNTTDLPFKHANGPDHFLDLEDLEPYQMEPESLSHFRHEFTAQVALARTANPGRFPVLIATNDVDRTRWLPGFLPWTITEHYARLKSAFSYLKALEEGGRPDEIANARDNVIYLMGVMGHFIGDAAQPLHTTKHYNGWVGENPNGYTTNRTFHAWIDGGYLLKVGLHVGELRSKVRPAKMLWPGNPKARHDDVFPQAMQFIVEQFRLVEPLYQLEKEGKLKGEGDLGRQGRAFLEKQILKAAQRLGDFWYSAWQQAPVDNYLKTQLAKRQASPAPAPAKP